MIIKPYLAIPYLTLPIFCLNATCIALTRRNIPNRDIKHPTKHCLINMNMWFWIYVILDIYITLPHQNPPVLNKPHPNAPQRKQAKPHHHTPWLWFFDIWNLAYPCLAFPKPTLTILNSPRRNEPKRAKLWLAKQQLAWPNLNWTLQAVWLWLWYLASTFPT
jgi:hypothetical protein